MDVSVDVRGKKYVNQSGLGFSVLRYTPLMSLVQRVDQTHLPLKKTPQWYIGVAAAMRTVVQPVSSADVICCADLGVKNSNEGPYLSPGVWEPVAFSPWHVLNAGSPSVPPDLQFMNLCLASPGCQRERERERIWTANMQINNASNGRQ